VKTITLTGATGRIGSLLVPRLLARGDRVTVLTRKPARARERLGAEVEAIQWNLMADPAPAALVASSAVGYYGNRAEPVDEEAAPGDDVLADICAAWEREAQRAEELGMRVVRVRTGVVLDRHGGALEKMLLPFRLGVGGPVAGGRQPMSWIHVEDVVGIYLAAIDDERLTGPVNATAPRAATNKEFSRALGRALKRPAFAPIPAFAIRALYGGMAKLVVEGQNAVPRRTLELGYRHEHPDLDEALRSALTKT
jgi:uncharacterized protein (TIGR01777 family)